MLSAGGRVSLEDRREVDLYIRTDNVKALFQRICDSRSESILAHIRARSGNV